MNTAMLRSMLAAALFACASHSVSQVIAQAEAPGGDAEGGAPALTIGSPAPALDIEHWVQDGEGKYPHVTKFDEGKVYVVEFWATWCGPCVASMPHLSETQQKYAGKAQIVSISDEDLDTVKDFLAREVRSKPQADDEEGKEKAEADAPKTYDDITKHYCLTTDPDGSCQTDYMKAAAQNGIPTAFLVGKSGRIEWIGHPMSMDDPLAAVVEDRWDRDAFKAEFDAEQKEQAMLQKVVMKLRQGKPDEAIAMIDEMIGKAQGKSLDRLLDIKLRLLVGTGADLEKVSALMEQLLEGAKGDPVAVNNYAWTAYQYFQSNGAGLDEAGKAFATKVIDVTSQAAEKAEGRDLAFILDTLAHLHDMVGDKAKALEVQRRAAAIEESKEQPSIAEFLEKLESEK